MKFRNITIAVVGLFVTVLFQPLFAEESSDSQKRIADMKEKEDTAKNKIIDCINGFMSEQEKGNSGDRYWKDKNLVVTFYSPTNWKIVKCNATGDVNHNSTTAKVRINSSTKGGLPIIKTWTFLMDKTDDEWKIFMVQSED